MMVRGRNGELVKLRKFQNEDVVEYLSLTLGDDFQVIFHSYFGKLTLAMYKDVYFGIHAKETLIELSYNSRSIIDMLEVIDVMRKWRRFREGGSAFYVDGEKDTTHYTIFEIGYSSFGTYDLIFNAKPIITQIN